MLRDVHESAFPEELAELERQRQAADRAAEIDARRGVVVELRPHARGGYCSDPRCKVFHPADPDRPVAA